MKKYKKYIIELIAMANEIREWDGHTTKGTGEYESWTEYRIINPSTAKVFSGFSTEQEAISFIDTYLSAEGRKRTLQIKNKIARIEKQITSTKSKISTLQGELLELEKQLPREAY